MERILVVEDDQEIARIMKDHLERNDYAVTWASTGQEGWDDFQEMPFDLVLVDLMLPEMNGFTVCKNIRLASDLPLIIISARTEDEHKVKGLDIGADDYLTKPFSLSELTARVKSHLRRYNRYLDPNQQEQEDYCFRGGLVINFSQRRVSLDHQEVNVTSKEYAILGMLARKPYQTFTKQDLYEHVWGRVDAGGNNTIQVHIKSLRNKLGENMKAPRYIETVWGSGYRFIGEPLS